MKSSPSALIVSPLPATSPLDARALISTVNEMKRRSSSITMDDTKIDYTSMLGMEDKRRRFSEDVVDMDLKDSVRLKKMYRQIQRQVHFNQQSKGTPTVRLLGWLISRKY